jgi:hypothetical protein
VFLPRADVGKGRIKLRSSAFQDPSFDGELYIWMNGQIEFGFRAEALLIETSFTTPPSVRHRPSGR